MLINKGHTGINIYNGYKLNIHDIKISYNVIQKKSKINPVWKCVKVMWMCSSKKAHKSQ